MYVLEATFNNGEKHLFGVFDSQMEANIFGKELLGRINSMVIKTEAKPVNKYK